MAAVIAIWRGILTFVLSAVFIASAVMKYSPVIDAATHNEMKAEFKLFAKVHPLVVYFGQTIDPDAYRVRVSIWELACVALLLLTSGLLNTLANICLMLVMVGAMYSHLAVGHAPERCIPAGVLLVLLTLRLLLSSVQTPEKQKDE